MSQPVMTTKRHKYQCAIEEQPLQHALVIRETTAVEDLPRELGRAYSAIAQYLTELNEEPSGPPFVAYFNMDMQNLHVAIGFPVARQLRGKANIDGYQIPARKVATCLHIGPYSEIHHAYETLTAWMQEQGYVPTGTAYEYYHNDSQETPPEYLITQVVFPINES